MKLTVDNLGGIKHAEIDIAPLTVFIGPNNTNKTWAAYSLYGLIQTFAQPWQAARYGPADPLDEISFEGPLKSNINTAVKRVIDFIKAAPTSTETPPGSVTGSSKTSVSVEVRRADLINGVRFPFRATMGQLGIQNLLALRLNCGDKNEERHDD